MVTGFMLALLTAGCSTDNTKVRIWTEAPGWSRAQKVGQSNIVDPAALTLDDEGNIYLVLVDLEDEFLHPSLVALDRQANTVWNKDIDLNTTLVDNPSILWDGEYVRVFWIGDGILYQAIVDKSGNVVDSPLALSGQTRVGNYAVGRHPDNTISVWYAGPRRDPGLYTLPVGELQGEPELVDGQGTRPAIKYDRAGVLHVAWVQHPPGSSSARIFYGSYPDGEFDLERAGEIFSERMAVTSIFSGPFLELDGESVYVIWSEETRTGSSAGQATTKYLTFPGSQPAQASGPIQIIVPSDRDLVYDYSPTGGLEAGPRALLVPGSFGGASGLSRIAVNLNLANEGVITSESRVDYLFSKTAPQIGANFFQNGSLNGYQLISFTSSASTSPAVISDEEGRLYLTWLERVGSESHVYFASTAQDVIGNLRSLTLPDARQLVGESVFGLLIGALLSPIALVIWMIIPLGVLLLTGPLRRGEPSLRNLGTTVSLGLAILAFLLLKFVSLPGIKEYVPFSAWLPLPSWIGVPLQIIVPLSITVIAILIAWTFTYRRKSNTPIYFIAIFGALDSLMTMAIYGVIIFNAL